ncbi:MAG: sulfite exporter TauE/SafE family protein [Gemmatimonadetes bacterium]|nr:sulfite exporter TauE/SafE family protein [Gemmatimonadota bacterium]MBT6144111.1 sulfite exporter TauE/SafE family protein [Gemmatimonadota bacterium]MBT7859480.1 sulfite exporter TauE/SafE family protein [Gemmatimonadota bacterium]
MSISSSELILITASFLTSLTSAIGGIAGGVMLIAVMPSFLPPAAVIPIHGVIQITSNVSRALFGIRHIQWRIVRDYGVGCVIGALLGSRLVPLFSWDNLPLLLGVFILLFTWMPKPSGEARWPLKFGVLGVLQTALSLFIGVAGPLNMPFLLRENLGRDRTVITHSVQMTFMHLMKVITFGLLGFAFAPYWQLVIGMTAGAILGSWVGTKVRAYVPENVFRHGVRILITVLAVRMLLQGFGILN